MSDLATRRCVPCEGGTTPLNQQTSQRYLDQLDDWQLTEPPNGIERTFRFDDFHQTMAFVNAVAWIAHTQDHHPDLNVSYRQCHVQYTTHAINGLSENDFICAARIEALVT